DAAHMAGSALTLLPAPGAPALVNGAKNVLGTASVIDQLAVVSGQMLGDQTTGNFAVTGALDNNRIVRNDGRTWTSLGFAVGQQVAFAFGDVLAGTAQIGARTVLGFDNTTPTSGFGSVLILSGAALTGTTNTGVVAVNNRNIVSSNT